MSSPTQPQRDRPPPSSIVPQPQTGVPEPRAPLDRHRHHLGRYAAVPGLLSPSPELPSEAGTITPPPNQIRPGSSSADWGLWGRGLRVRNCFLSASQIGHDVSPFSARPGSPNQGWSPRGTQIDPAVREQRPNRAQLSPVSGSQQTLVLGLPSPPLARPT